MTWIRLSYDLKTIFILQNDSLHIKLYCLQGLSMGSDPMDGFLLITHPLALAAVFHTAYFTISLIG